MPVARVMLLSYWSQAMKREDFRCIVTRIPDSGLAREFRSSTGRVFEEYSEPLECCHIFAESTNLNVDEENKVSVS